MKDKKVLLVTGASSDVGQNLIRTIAGNYDVIFAHYCHGNGVLESLKREIGSKLFFLQADFAKDEDVEAMVEEIDRKGLIPDHIIHLPAQRVDLQKFHKTEVEQYQLGFDIAVLSIVRILRHFLPAMSRQKYGKIIFMLTSSILNAPPKYQAPYITVKYALLGLMRAISREYADKGIMANGISPDMIETKFLSDIPEIVIQQNAANSPMRRNLTVDDVIPAFQYLLSDGADMVTGQNIGITGGIQ